MGIVSSNIEVTFFMLCIYLLMKVADSEFIVQYLVRAHVMIRQGNTLCLCVPCMYV